MRGASAWSGGPQTRRARSRATRAAPRSRRSCSTAPRSQRAGGVVTVARRGRARAARRRARCGGQRDRRRASSLGRGLRARRRSASVSADFIAREVRVDVADALSGVAAVEVRLAGAVLETRLAADGRTAVARVPAGLTLDGARVSVRVLDASSPPMPSELGVTLPVRPRPALRGLSVSRAGVDGPRRGARARARADLGLSQGPCAAPRRQLSRRAPTARSRCAVRPRRTHALRRRVLESQGLLGLPEQSAGTLRVTARITGLKLRARGGRLSVSARFGGRGEATRLHLLVHDLRGGRWVEGCLEHGRPGVHLERTGRVWGSCRIPRVPAAAPGRIASSWRRPRAPGRGVRRRAPRAASSSRSEAESWDRRATSCDSPVKAAIGAARTGGSARVDRARRALGRVAGRARAVRLRPGGTRHAAGRLRRPAARCARNAPYGRK